MTSNRDINDLQSLLQASPEQLASLAEGVELPSPEAFLIEEEMVQAWMQPMEAHIQEPTESPEQAGVQSSRPGFLAVLLSWIRSPYGLVGVPALACLAFLVTMGPFKLGISPSEPPEQLVNKGHMSGRPLVDGGVRPGHLESGHIERASASAGLRLRLGVWDEKTATAKRVGDGDVLRSSRRLYFGAMLGRAGYAYLFLKKEGEPSYALLIPRKGETPVQVKKGFGYLKSRGVVQRYHLQGEKGILRFLLVSSVRPLRKEEQRAFSASPKAAIQQTKRGEVRMAQVAIRVVP